MGGWWRQLKGCLEEEMGYTERSVSDANRTQVAVTWVVAYEPGGAAG